MDDPGSRAHLGHTIVRAAPEDAPAMLALQRRAFAEEARRCGTLDIPPMTEPLDAIAQHIRQEIALTARDATTIVGCVRGIVADGVCTIRALVVEPARHGRGIGTSLLLALEDAARGPVSRFDLTTNTVMEGNVPFYERHGYRVTSRTPWTGSIVLAHMSKPACS
ncbi:MAG: GNAT family N-acetyltransferase [Burkholderiales bacterium]